MGINTKDIKILWAKAAGRCSMPDCRKRLVANASDAVKSKNTLIGENCHIVGDKETSPRGKSILTEDERNRYPNLILLCRNHHKIIDDDEHGWPVERLHQVKTEHEIWVETALAERNDTDEEWYALVINEITEKFILLSWEGLSDNALRGIIHYSFIDGVTDIDLYLFKAIYPQKYPELEEAINNLVRRARQYTDHFTSNSYLDSHNCHRGRKFYKEVYPNPDYNSDLKKYKRWEVKCTRLLFNLTCALNEFAEQVRKNVNPDYFKLQGRFVVFDSMGVLNSMLPGSFLPEEYFPDEVLEQLQEDEKNAEQTH